MAPITKDTGDQVPMNSEQKTKVTLYWLEKSRSQRILWLFEELKIDYELKTFKRVNMLAPAELKEVHPLGKSPVVTIEAEGMSKPLVLAESGLIVEYFVDHFGTWLAPKRYVEGNEGQAGAERDEWIRYRYFMHYTEGSITPLLVIALLMSSIKKNSPFFIKPIASAIVGQIDSLFLDPNFETHFNFLENQISTSPGGGDYLCGSDFTGADIMMSFPLAAAKGRAGFSKEKFPKLWAYVDKIEQREAFKKAVQKIIDIEGSYDPSL